MTPQDNRRIENIERDIDDLRIRTNRMPVREAKVNSVTGNVIYAQVNEATGVATGDATFSFDNAVAEVGSIPTDGTGTAQNQYGQEYADNEWVHLFQRKDNGQWQTERGGSAGTTLRRFSATSAKDWDGANCDGTLLDGSDTPTGSAIKLVERAPYKHEVLVGSRGWCFYSETVEGVDHYFILVVDSPARWIEGPISEEWELTDASVRLTVDEESVHWWGASPNHMDPVTYNHDFGTGGSDIRAVVDIHDTIGIRTTLLPVHTYIHATWDEKREKWVLTSIRQTPAAIPATAMITATCAAMATSDGSAKTATPGVSVSDEAAAIMKWSTTTPPTLEEDERYPYMHVLNMTETVIHASTSNPQLLHGYIQEFTEEVEGDEDIQVFYFVFSGPFDLRSLANYSKTDKQIFYHAADSANGMLGGEECE